MKKMITLPQNLRQSPLYLSRPQKIWYFKILEDIKGFIRIVQTFYLNEHNGNISHSKGAKSLFLYIRKLQYMRGNIRIGL